MTAAHISKLPPSIKARSLLIRGLRKLAEVQNLALVNVECLQRVQILDKDDVELWLMQRCSGKVQEWNCGRWMSRNTSITGRKTLHPGVSWSLSPLVADLTCVCLSAGDMGVGKSCLLHQFTEKKCECCFSSSLCLLTFKNRIEFIVVIHVWWNCELRIFKIYHHCLGMTGQSGTACVSRSFILKGKQQKISSGWLLVFFIIMSSLLIRNPSQLFNSIYK